MRAMITFCIGVVCLSYAQANEITLNEIIVFTLEDR